MTLYIITGTLNLPGNFQQSLPASVSREPKCTHVVKMDSDYSTFFKTIFVKKSKHSVDNVQKRMLLLKMYAQKNRQMLARTVSIVKYFFF